MNWTMRRDPKIEPEQHLIPGCHGAEATKWQTIAWFIAALTVAFQGAALADSSTPRLASYYDRHMAICAGDAHVWSDDGTPQRAMRDVVQVGVGTHTSYALKKDGRLYGWRDDPRAAAMLLDSVRNFAAGDSGVLAIRADGSLWRIEKVTSRSIDSEPSAKTHVTGNVRAASVGDGTNYYITGDGDLLAMGKSHRGQFGDGRLEGTEEWVRVASAVVEIKSHTGHAILLTDRGEVRGTGGNIHGPLGRTGLGDKVVRWSSILDDATAIATGSSHSLAIRADQSLWIWGRNESPEPTKVLANVIGAAGGSNGSLALTADGTLWQWRTGKRPLKVMDCRP